MTQTYESNLDASALDATLPEDVELAANAAAHEMCALLYREPHLWGEVTIGADHVPAFWRPSFVALRRLHERGAEPTRALVADELLALTGRYDGIGDRRIDHLAQRIGIAANLPEYQRVIRRAADRDRLGRLVQEIRTLVNRGDTDAAWAALNQATAETPDGRERRTLKEILWTVMEQLESPVKPVATGIPLLDHMLAGGIRPGEVMVIGARPGVGKSALALQVILHVLDSVGPVSVWSLEMSREQWIRRALATLALVNSRNFRTGRFAEEEHQRILQATAVLHKLPLDFADTMDTTPGAWRMEASRAVRKHGAKLLVIDYLQLMQPPPGAWSRENEVGTISRTVKLAALELDVPIILLAQLNREAQDRPPTLRNLRESGAVEQDADVVLFIHRDLDPETGRHDDDGMLILAKQRDGETGVVPIHYDGPHYRFTELTTMQPPPDQSRRRGRTVPYADD